jgi:hypothetical protein
MKERVLKFVGYFIIVSVGTLLAYSIFYSTLNSIQKVLYQENIPKQFEIIKKDAQKSLKEIQEKIAPQIEPPESGLRINTKLEFLATSTVLLSFKTTTRGNDFYWKLESVNNSQNLPVFFQFLLPLISDWKKLEIKNEDVEKLKKIKEISERKWIFKEFKEEKDGYDFIIDEEKLKSILLEEGIKEGGEFLDDFKEISGRIYFHEGNLIEKIEIFGENKRGENIKIIFEFENLKEVMIRNNNREGFEDFLISILTH